MWSVLPAAVGIIAVVSTQASLVNRERILLGQIRYGLGVECTRPFPRPASAVVDVSCYIGAHGDGAQVLPASRTISSAAKAVRSLTGKSTSQSLCNSDSHLPRMTSRSARVMYMICPRVRSRPTPLTLLPQGSLCPLYVPGRPTLSTRGLEQYMNTDKPAAVVLGRETV